MSEDIFLNAKLNDRTIISERIFRRLPEDKRPELDRSEELCNCSGDPIGEIGKGNFKLDIGPVTIHAEVIVADIAYDGLLGIDILTVDGKPADVLLSKGIIVLHGKEIPCKMIRKYPSIRRVSAADDEVIPPYSEKLIDVYVQRFEEKTDPMKNLLISPTENFSTDYPLLMARCLIDMQGNVTSKLRVINPYKTEAIIRQDANIAEVEICTPLENLSAEKVENGPVRQILGKTTNLSAVNSRPQEGGPT